MNRGSLKSQFNGAITQWMAVIIFLLSGSLLVDQQGLRAGMIRQNLGCTIKECLFRR